MNILRQTLADYLAVRRALGYRLARAEKLLVQFLAFVEDRGEERLTIETALAWATAPAGADPNWMSRRLSDVRRFAIHLRAIDPATQVSPADILPGRSRRATPYLYSTEAISDLMAATATLRGSHRRATYRTLIGLLAATGMRVGEAIGLDRNDFAICGVLTIHNGSSANLASCQYIRVRSPLLATISATSIVFASCRTSRPCCFRRRARGCSIRTCRTRSSGLFVCRHYAAFGGMPAEAARSSTRLCGQHHPRRLSRRR
jgi:site-specific recombinase XerD